MRPIAAGLQGQAGLQGSPGQAGAPGLSCWDLNGNNAHDPEEDANGDKKWDAKDCHGSKGETGRACWDLNSNGIGDPREDLNQDDVWDSADCRGDMGLTCWDLDGDSVTDAEEDANADGEWDALDCKGAQGLAGTAGPAGPKGEAGSSGQAGLAGADGVSCWDLNADGLAGSDEDLNGDALVDARDCQGPQGLSGLRGEMGPVGPAGRPGADGAVLAVDRQLVPASNRLTTVDSAGRVGDNGSITIGADGLPVISYYDDTNKDLKVAHCADPACASAATAGCGQRGRRRRVQLHRARRERPAAHRLLRCRQRLSQAGPVRQRRLHGRTDREGGHCRGRHVCVGRSRR